MVSRWKMGTVLILIVLLPGSYAQVPAQAEVSNPTQQLLFEKVFGALVDLDPRIAERVKSSTPGERHWIDSDNDGKPQEVWFIDTDTRHPEEMRPVLVRVLDEDGDLEWGKEPDLDSDLYIADWNADGTVDAVLDYTDNDGDDDVDEMGLYFYDGGGAGLGGPLLRVWWSRDVGDDNLLWFDVGYTYKQPLCQLRTHFGGDELFVAFAIGLDGEEWIPFWENPFSFYDRDSDGVTEEVFRISGNQKEVRTLRHSFDVDNDGTRDSPRDYDVSLTAHAPEGLTFPEESAEQITLRGIPTGPFLTHPAGPDWSSKVVWERMMLTWDEDDLNIDRDQFADEEERWEGVIADGNDDFPQVGGPSCGPFNKRYELLVHPEEPARFYFHPADRRIHLKGATRVWMKVDIDNDRQMDMKYEMLDTNLDGFIDTWRIDLDGDGKVDDIWQCSSPPETRMVNWEWGDLNAVMEKTVTRTAEELFELNEKLGKAIYIWTEKPPRDPVGRLIRNAFRGDSISRKVSYKLISSKESLRFYFDLHKDVLIHRLREAYDVPLFWKAFDEARSKGDYKKMTSLLDREFQLGESSRSLDTWQEHRITLLTPDRVAWAEDWVPPNIGWESDKVAYRAYWGQFDFFGKKENAGLIYPTIGAKSYHEETEWGIDALLVGSSPGCGGVTLYVNGTPYPVRSPEGKGQVVFTKRLVEENDDHVTIEMTAGNVGPSDATYTVRFRCTALAGRPDSPVEVVVEGGKPDEDLQLGIGLVKLPDEAVLLDTSRGVFGSWGIQTSVIGRIGLGILFPSRRYQRFADLPEENQVVLSIRAGEPVVYHIYCDWLRGRRFSRCPTAADWLDRLRETATGLALR